MDIKQLQTFVAVARLLNFRAAAETLNYSQSTVSDHINNLEQELGVRLFERLGRRVFLSAHGERLIASAERMIQGADEIRGLFLQDVEVCGSLKIGAAETLCAFWLPPLLKEYRLAYPNVQVMLKMADCLEFRKMLEQNLIDVAFSLHDESGHTQLIQIDLFEDFTNFVAAPDHPLAALETVSVRELADQSLILTNVGGYRTELEELLRNRNVTLERVMEFGSLEAIKQCVKNGLGLSLLPKITIDQEIRRGELAVLSVAIEPILIHAKMVFHREKWLSAPMAALRDMVLRKTAGKE